MSPATVSTVRPAPPSTNEAVPPKLISKLAVDVEALTLNPGNWAEPLTTLTKVVVISPAFSVTVIPPPPAAANDAEAPYAIEVPVPEALM